MLRPFRSKLFTLSLAFPAASWALGLGDIHVKSALDQPLSAQIELIGATPDDAAILTARILNDGEFRQHGLEWPSFLSGTTLTVGRDEQGNPALIVHSIERVSEPVVTVLIGLDSPSGQLIREYTLLLDPVDRVPQPSAPDAAAITQAVAANMASPAPATAVRASRASAEFERARATSDAKPPRPAQTPDSLLYTVAAHDTLERIARRAGASSETELRRMAIAIYHANPDAFRANLNLLRRGATLRLPDAAQLAAISAQDAVREYAAQLQAWRAGVHGSAPAATQRSPTTSPAAVDSRTRGGESDETQVRLLTEQVQLLQSSLNELQQELKRPVVIPATTAVGARSTGANAPARNPAFAATPHVATPHARSAPVAGTNPNPVSRAAGRPQAPFAALVVCGALVLAAGIWLRRRRQDAEMTSGEPDTAEDLIRETGTDQSKPNEGPPPPQTTVFSAPASPRQGRGDTRADMSPVAPPGQASGFNTVSSNRVDDLSAKSSVAGRSAPNYTDPTVKLSMPIAGKTMETAVQLTDVDTSDDTERLSFFDEKTLEDTHVVMGSGLTETVPFVERRKNPADVLRQAIEREPHRNDLRLKLLELYYTAASQNRRAFLEIVRELAKNEGLVSSEDWSRIMDMGRAIAPEDELFSGDKGSKAVA
jgi:pilus assembly protein FimV